MLVAAHAFGDARTELIEGDVILMSPQYRPHGMVKLALYDAFREALQNSNSALTAVTEFSLALDNHTMPEPDIMLTTEPSGDGPVPFASVALVIEVADTTLDIDLGRKAALYAGAKVPEYWVADVANRVIHQMWLPESAAYTKKSEISLDAMLTTRTIAGLTISIGSD